MLEDVVDDGDWDFFELLFFELADCSDWPGFSMLMLVNVIILDLYCFDTGGEQCGAKVNFIVIFRVSEVAKMRFRY